MPAAPCKEMAHKVMHMGPVSHDPDFKESKSGVVMSIQVAVFLWVGELYVNNM